MLFRSLILCVLLGVTVVLSHYSPAIKAGDNSGVIMQLPSTLPGLISVVDKPDDVELRELPEDTQFVKRTYFTPTDSRDKMDVVRCSIVLSGAERKSIHRPERCLVGQGWTVATRHVIPIRIDDQRSMEVTDLSIERKHTMKTGEIRTLRAHYVYWFVGSDITTPSHASRAVITLMDNIFRNVNHRWAYAAVLAINTEGYPVEELGQRQRNDAETLVLLSRVIAGIVPTFQKEFATSAVQTPQH